MNRVNHSYNTLFEDPTETLWLCEDTEISCTQSDAVTLARTHPCQRLVALHFDLLRSRMSYDDGVSFEWVSHDTTEWKPPHLGYFHCLLACACLQFFFHESHFSHLSHPEKHTYGPCQMQHFVRRKTFNLWCRECEWQKWVRRKVDCRGSRST